MAQRIPDLRAKMHERGLDALVVTHPANRFYLSGYTADDVSPDESAGALLIVGEGSYLITSPTNLEMARVQAVGYEVVPRGKGLPATVADLLKRNAARRLGFEENALLVVTYRELEEALAGEVDLVAVGNLVSDLRLIKSEDELERIACAARVTDEAFMAVWPRLRPDQTEREVAWLLDQAMREAGADALAFPTIVAAGSNGAFPHHEPGDTPLGEGLPITIDMGARVHGYAADLTRAVILGEPTDQARAVYRAVLAAVEAAEAGIKAGMTGAAADALARDAIVEAGYGDYFVHGLGHGVGVRVHEAPSATKDIEEPLPASATLTIEPGIYIPDWGGCRIEDLVVIEEESVRVLSQAEKQRV